MLTPRRFFRRHAAMSRHARRHILLRDIFAADAAAGAYISRAA